MTYYRHYLDKNPSDCCKPKQHYSELVMFSLKAKPQVLSVLLTEWYVEERTFEVQKITQSPFLIASWVSWTCQSWNLEQLGEHSEFACSKLDENLRPSLELRRKCCKILSLSGFLELIRSLFYLINLFFIIYNCVSVTKRIMFRVCRFLPAWMKCPKPTDRKLFYSITLRIPSVCLRQMESVYRSGL